MTAAPFMQLYVGDYLADTLDLTCEEHGAYLLLLMTMWRHDAKLPNDPKKLARIARLSARKWEDVWASISRFFAVEGDSIVNQRLSKEYKKAEAKSELRADAGRKGGQAKALKSNDSPVANASVLLKHSSDIRYQSSIEIGKPISCAFEEFWSVWPSKKAKKDAAKAWDKLSADDRTKAKDAAAAWFAKWRASSPSASPIHAASYLNGRRWEDEIEPPMLRAINGGQSPPVSIPKPDLAAIYARSPELKR
jgi:uncharacterized protein YdaU (DUF1376 family)